MSSHRYWRIRRLSSQSGPVELSELQLCKSTTRVDSGATLTASESPIAGSLGSLSDAATSAVVRLSRAVVLHWDLGSAIDVDNLAMGGGDSVLLWPVGLLVEYSDDDATWSPAEQFAPVGWPGVRAMSTNEPVGNWIPENTGFQNGWTASFNTARDEATFTSTGSVGKFLSTPSIPGGPRQVEFVLVAGYASPGYHNVGFGTILEGRTYGAVGVTGNGFSYFDNAYKRNSGGNAAYGAGWAIGDVIGAVYDDVAGTIEFYKNGVSQGVAFTGLAYGEPLYPMATSEITISSTYKIRTKGFTYPVPGAGDWNTYDQRIVKAPFSLPKSLSARRIFFAGAAWSAYDPAKILGDRRSWNRQGGPAIGSDYGYGFIHSTVKKKADPVNLPLRRRVRLYREVDGRLIMETFSDAVTGAYEFNYIDPVAKYTVIAYDHLHNYRAAIADNLTPEVLAS